MLPNLLRARSEAALVSIPDGGLIIIGGYSASEAHNWMDSVEFLSLNALQLGWWNIAPLPQPISSSGAVYFHDFVIIAGGAGERGRPLATVYALKPPRLSVINKTGYEELDGLGQWTKLSAELPSPTLVHSICRVGEELFTFRELNFYRPSLFYLYHCFLQIKDIARNLNFPAMKIWKSRKVK